MQLIALCPARNESWCLGATARAALKWAHALVVLNHASTDATAETVAKVADEHPGRVAILNERRHDWDEAEYRQRLLAHGRRLGGTHFALIDADELLTGNLLPRVRNLAESLHVGECLRLPWFCLWRSLDQFRDDTSTFGRAYAPVLFRDDGKLAHRAGENGYQIHTRAPQGCKLSDLCGRDVGLMHLQHVSWRRVTAKQTLYRMVERMRWGKSAEETERRYGPATDETGIHLSDVPARWWEGYEALRHLIRPHEVPWQEGEIERLRMEHGANYG